jgi:hypothetical protein
MQSPNKGEGMVWQHVRTALLASLVAAGLAVTARADDCCSPAPCTRTCYRTEYRTETYTAYRCETVPETRTRVCTVYRSVPEVRTETRCYSVCIPTVEQRTVMQRCWTTKQVTTMSRRCVDRGHWECRQVPCEESTLHRFWGHMKRKLHHHHDGCCCEQCCQPCCPPPMKTVRCWVPCPTWEEVPVTCCQRVCEMRPVTCNVTVMHREMRQQQCQVTCWKCVPEQRTETYTVCCMHRVPYQATRCVAVCVPYQVPVQPCQPTCETTCCKQSCCDTCCHRRHHHRCSGLHLRHEGCCCN